MPEIHVVIASVPWREENLRGLISDLRQQSIIPASITVLLDGYPTEGWVACPEDVQTHEVYPSGTGIWFRWKYASTLRGLVAFIDDDFRLGPGYLESLHTCRKNHNDAVVSWHAPDVAGYNFVSQHDKQVHLVGAGMCLFDPDQVRGMHEDPEIQGLQCADEPFLAYWLWKAGIEMWRPGGPPQAQSDPEVSRTSRAKRYTGVVTRRFVIDICLARGWPYRGKKPKLSSVILYYSHGGIPGKLQDWCFARILKHKPHDAQLRCVVPSGVASRIDPLAAVILEQECQTPGHDDMFSRILKGLEGLPDNTIVALAEHDVWYGPQHFLHMNTPFEEFAWPGSHGVRFDVQTGRYTEAPHLLSSLRGRAGALRELFSQLSNSQELPKILEPVGVEIPAWKAAFIDLRWGGNLTGRRAGTSIMRPPDLPEEKQLQQTIRALLRGEPVQNVTADKPKPLTRAQPKKPYNPLQTLLEQRRNRYKR